MARHIHGAMCVLYNSANQKIELQADGYQIHDHDLKTLGRAEALGAATEASDSPSTEKEVRIDFQIPNELPSTNGKHIDCRYRLDILAEVDMAPDIEIHFPLNIFMPPVEWQEVVADVADYKISVDPCVVKPIPFADGTVIDIVPEAAVVIEASPTVSEDVAPEPSAPHSQA